MTTTNDAFIKAYRADAARASAPKPAHLRQAAGTGWQTSVEIVTTDYAFDERTLGSLKPDAPLAVEQHQATAPHRQRSIGRQPLSAYLAEQVAEPERVAAVFTPETTVAAFRWPRVCHALWEQYRDQYDRVAQLLLTECRNERSLIGVAGLRPGDGCTTTLLCLAMGLAARNARVILVDANFAAPRLAQRLGAEPSATWQDVLARGVTLAEAVVHAAEDQVDLLPLDCHIDRGEQLAAGLQMAVTAGVLRHAYDIALIDLGPTLGRSSFATTGQLVRNMRIDAAVLVTDSHGTRPSDVATAGALLGENGCELLGTIENRAAKPQATGRG